MQGQRDAPAGGQPSSHLLPSQEKAVPVPGISWALALRFWSLEPGLGVRMWRGVGRGSWGNVGGVGGGARARMQLSSGTSLHPVPGHAAVHL